MAINTTAPWHKASFDRFINERLPQLLAERLPLTGFRVEPQGRHACRVIVVLTGKGSGVELRYDVPAPDEQGIFEIDGKRRVVLPVASSEILDTADIKCIGEQLYEYIEQQLGEAPPQLPWDETLGRAWLALDRWMGEFIGGTADDRWTQNTELVLGDRPTSQPLDERNWLARCEHLRRLSVPDAKKVIDASHFGRTCPVQTPEGPNIGRVLHIAVGAEIRDGRLVIVDDRPEAALSVGASMVPFLEHSDANRLLMGVNMMRQWLVPADPEAALVQTGNEPDAADFWCGRNLLTAFVSWGGDNYEDSIIISASAARKLDMAGPLECGDKLSNRHGTKGTIGRILPDEHMPHLADGMPVELVFNFTGLHTRLNFGQIREALMGRIARAEGKTAIVPPFGAPGEQELRQRLMRAGLPESGMEQLRDGTGGPELEMPSLVGWVYWGKTHHLAAEKLSATVSSGGMQQRELEYYTLRDADAVENLREVLNTRSSQREDAATLADRVARGRIEQAPPPSPWFTDLSRSLAAAGVAMELDGGRVTFRLAEPAGAALKLARPVLHPWLSGQAVSAMGPWPQAPEYAAVVEANDRLKQMLSGSAPASLVDRATGQLQSQVHRLFDELVNRQSLTPGGRVLFSGKAVISPGADLRLDQLGIPDEMAWTLFTPLLKRHLGAAVIEARTPQAGSALDELMARCWVLLNRAPSLQPTSIIAFHPVRRPERVIRLHPLACMFLNGDFDGDQCAVFLPVTESAQREAGDKLSVAAHLRRDPSLVRWLAPSQDIVWGLAWLSRQGEGLEEIHRLMTVNVGVPDGFVDSRDADRRGPPSAHTGRA